MENHSSYDRIISSVGYQIHKVDVIATFLYADFNKGENIYVEIPKFFNQKVKNVNNKVFKLKNTL